MYVTDRLIDEAPENVQLAVSWFSQKCSLLSKLAANKLTMQATG